MAFLDLTVGAPVPVRQDEKRAITTARLGAIERQVVLLSRSDTAASLAARTTVSRISAMLFGIGAPQRLADPRLEALRRYAVMYRLNGDDAAETDAARAAGYSDGELAQARGLLDRIRGTAPNTGGRLARLMGSLALLGGLTTASALALIDYFDSEALAIILTGVGLASLLSLFAERSSGPTAAR